MAIFLTPEEILDLTAEAVRLLHDKGYQNPKYLFSLAQNTVLEPHRRRDVEKMSRNQYEWLYLRAWDQKNREDAVNRKWQQEISDLRQGAEKAVKIHDLLESLVRELGIEKSDDSHERQAQLEERMESIEGRMEEYQEVGPQLANQDEAVEG